MEEVAHLVDENLGAEDVCRACMLAFAKDSMVFLYDSSNTNVADIFYNCTSLEVFRVCLDMRFQLFFNQMANCSQATAIDGLPEFICQRCHTLLLHFNEFRTKCATSDAIFRRKRCKLHTLVQVNNVVCMFLIFCFVEQPELKSRLILAAASMANTKKLNSQPLTYRQAVHPKKFKFIQILRIFVSKKPAHNKLLQKLYCFVYLPTEPKNELNLLDDPDDQSDDDNDANYEDDDDGDDDDGNDDDDVSSDGIKKETVVTKRRKKKTKNKDSPPKDLFKCDLCDKRFFKKHRLEGHLRTHQGLKVGFF